MNVTGARKSGRNITRFRNPFCVLTLAACALVSLPVRSSALTVPVTVNVAGSGPNQTIGFINANGGFAGNGAVASGLRADFTFSNAFSSLDNNYDFDWVNVCTKQTFGVSGPSALFPNTPNIDPIPAEDDKLPYYYNSTEWFTNNEFVQGFPIHADNSSSTFFDIPNQPADRTFYFLTFLVLRDNGAYTLNGASNTFSVLAGFSWQYQGADGNFNTQRGTSTVVSAVSINQDAVDIINGAITNSPDFGNWTVTINPTLVPEPSTAFLVLVGYTSLLLRCSKRHAKARSTRES